ncbi:hypothetical protein GCM10010095_34680 [Streptomyces anthocyanicus]|nr:hypothetical protein GCM10010095_34680 [Streptomyces anthocyanicus]GHC18183.1 hypothetical protein GCM10010348_48330 [Streptomyces anthocyanicus]
MSIFIVTASTKQKGAVPEFNHVPRTARNGAVKVSTQACQPASAPERFDAPHGR